MAFTTIELAPALGPARRRRARALAPRAAATRRPYRELLASAGFVEVGERDVTAEYLTTTRSWLSCSESHREELSALDGADVVTERLSGWRDAIPALERRWLRRTLYWATRP